MSKFVLIGGIIALAIILIVLVVLMFVFRSQANSCADQTSQLCATAICDNGEPAQIVPPIDEEG